MSIEHCGETTSPRAFSCLKQLVEDVDDGKIGAFQASVSYTYLLQTVEDYPSQYGCPPHTYLKCGVQDCAAEATIQENPDGPYINLASFHDLDGDCVQEAHDNSDLPRQIDELSCLATATAYALNKFGNEFTASDVDWWLGRVSGEYPSTEGTIALNLALLENDFQLKIVSGKDALRMQDYYREDSKLTYEDYKSAVLALRPWNSLRDWLDTAYTEDVYEKEMAYRREQAVQFEPFVQSGQLSYEWRDVTPEYLADSLKYWAIRGKIGSYNGETDLYHAVVLEHIREVVGGKVVARYFDPGFDRPSKFTTRRARDIGNIFLLDEGITMLRPYTQ